MKTEKYLEDAKKAFSERLKQFMTRTGAGQAAAYTAMEVTDTTFQNYLTGKTCPSVDKVSALAKKFGYEPKWFFQADAEIALEDIQAAVRLVEEFLEEKGEKVRALDAQKKATVVALTARSRARERELGQSGGLEERLRKFVEETFSILG
jgi:transcriptional regulator with XRE-family HTH domain